MEKQELPANLTGTGRERRRGLRYPVDQDATILVLSRNQLLRCRVLDLSLEGCHVRGADLTRLAAGTPIEVNFKLNGAAFRLSGAVRWASEHRDAGIYFLGRNPRQTSDLQLILAEIELTVGHKEEEAAASKPAASRTDANQIGASPESESVEAQPSAAQTAPVPATQVQPAAAQPAPAQTAPVQPSPAQTATNPAAAGPASSRPEPSTPASSISVSSEPVPPLLVPAMSGAAAPANSSRERRSQTRESVDSGATIYLVKGGAKFDGRIVDLSLGGCCIRTRDAFPVGIYTRAEVEFRLQGLPFRLGGVVQSLRNETSVGIRFLDASERKMRQIAELIAEIQAANRTAPRSVSTPFENSSDSGV